MSSSELKLQNSAEQNLGRESNLAQNTNEEIFIKGNTHTWRFIDFHELWRYRELIYFLSWRDIKVKYKQAALGIAWVIAQPLFSMVAFTFLLGRLAKIESDGVPYAAFSFSALIPWNSFVAAINKGSLSLVGSGTLFSKVYFPRVLIPVSSVISVVLDYLIGMGTLFLVLAWYGYYPQISWTLELTLLTMMVFSLACGVSLWLGALNVKYRDVSHILPFIIQAWMFLTPIVYPVSAIPKRYLIWANLNPMTGIVEAYRSVFFDRALNWSSISISFAINLLVLVSGIIFFYRTERKFADIV